MSPQKRELLAYLAALPRDVFSLSRKLDSRRYLARDFPKQLPLVLTAQSYPGYRRMVGENWMHWHDYYELWIACGGGGEYCVGTQTFSFAPGDIVLVDPLKLHGVVRMEKTHAPLVVFFRTEAVAPGGSDIDLQFLSGWDRRPEKTNPKIDGDAAAAAGVQGALLRLAQAWFAPASAEGRQLALRFHLLDLLMQLRRAFDAPGGTPEAMPARAEREARLGRVLEFLAQRCHGHVSQLEAARVASMSTSRFRVFFKETTGWGFGDYLRDLRLERAARLLRETSDSVAEVAYRTGFSDQSHLQRLFKAKHATSPLAYRKQHGP